MSTDYAERIPSSAGLAGDRRLRRALAPGKIAAWLAPPRTGINGQPADYEYVRF